jgi:hypothetical protein
MSKNEKELKRWQKLSIRKIEIRRARAMYDK